MAPKLQKNEAWEMAQELISLDFLPYNQGSIPSAYIYHQYQGYNVFFWHLWAAGLHMLLRHIYVEKYPHT